MGLGRPVPRVGKIELSKIEMADMAFRKLNEEIDKPSFRFSDSSELIKALRKGIEDYWKPDEVKENEGNEEYKIKKRSVVRSVLNLSIKTGVDSQALADYIYGRGKLNIRGNLIFAYKYDTYSSLNPVLTSFLILVKNSKKLKITQELEYAVLQYLVAPGVVLNIEIAEMQNGSYSFLITKQLVEKGRISVKNLKLNLPVKGFKDFNSAHGEILKRIKRMQRKYSI